MNQRLRTGFQDYEKMLLDATKYTGNKDPGVRKFSASMLGNDVLQNFYKFLHGSKESTQFEANSLGSIYQLGVDKACENSIQYKSAERFSFTLDNGWEISGEIDQLDMTNWIIFDNKVTNITTIKKIRKEGKWHSYALQLAVYNWLLVKNGITGVIGEYNTWIAGIPAVDKGFSYFNDKSPNQLEFIEIEIFEPDEIEAMLYEKTDELDEYIKLDTAPPECTNLFWFAARGQRKKKMRCIHYCDHSSICEYYNNQNDYGNQRKEIQDLLDL